MSQVGREWRGRGIKPIIPTIMKFEYRYLYKAVSPITGDSFSFVMPDMTTESLNLFLKEFSKYLGERKAIVVMDNASSHRSKRLEVPTNIQMVYLPPYSPELNPVERVFQDIKKHLKNKVFNVIEELEDTVCGIVKLFTPQRLKKLTFYPYIKEAVLG
jgi:transposase